MPVFNALSNAVAQFMMGGNWMYWLGEAARLIGG